MKPVAVLPGLITALDRLPDLEAVAAALVADFDEGLALAAEPCGLRSLALKSPRPAELIDQAQAVWASQVDRVIHDLNFRIVRAAGVPVGVLGLTASAVEIDQATAVLGSAFKLDGGPRLKPASLIIRRLLGGGDELNSLGLDEKRLYELIDNAVDAIFFNDGHGFVLTNPRFRELVGRSSAQLADKRLTELFGEAFVGAESGGLGTCEFEFVRPDDQKIWLKIDNITIQLDQGQMLAGIVRDVTAKRQMLELKSRFVQVASHELRSPLTVIRGYARLLLKDLDPALGLEQRGMLAEIASQAERLTDFCNRLLDFSSSANGQLCLVRGLVKPQALVAEVVARQRVKAAERGVELVLTSDSAELPEVCLDALRIEQALVNLIENAIKFSPVGGLVRVVLGCDEPGTRCGANLLIEVCDEGPGVSSGEAARLFDEFYVGVGGRENGGFGLGLAISREIVSAHGGSIRVETASQGGHFIITIPLNPLGD